LCGKFLKAGLKDSGQKHTNTVQVITCGFIKAMGKLNLNKSSDAFNPVEIFTIVFNTRLV
jgi:hypothetical protein